MKMMAHIWPLLNFFAPPPGCVGLATAMREWRFNGVLLCTYCLQGKFYKLV